MSDGKPIEYDELFTPDAWEKFIANLEKAKGLLGDVNGGLTSISKQKIGDLQGGTTSKKSSVDDIKKENDAIAKINATYEAKIKLMKEEANIDKQIIQFKNDLKKADKADADAKKKTADEQKKANTLSREQIQIAKLTEKANNSAAGSYNQLSAKLGLAQIKLKAMSQAQRDNSKEGKILQAQVLSYQNQLIRLDEKSNVHVRHVGDYTGALSKLSKGFGGLAKLIAGVAEAFGIETAALTELAQVGREAIRTSIELREANIGINEAKREEAIVTDEQTGAEEAHNVAMAESVALTEENAIATEVYAGWTQAEVDAQIEAIAAQEALNAAQAATPWGLIAIGITAAIGAIALYVSYSEKAKKAEEYREMATDGMIIKNKDLRESYNKLILSNHELNNEVYVATGRMTAYAAAINNIEFKNLQEYNNHLHEIAAKVTEDEGIWNDLVSATVGFNMALYKGQKELAEYALQMKINNKIEEDALAVKKKLQERTDEQDYQKGALELEKQNLENSGSNTIAIRKKILEQEKAIALIRAETELDATGKMLLIDEKYLTDLAALEGEELRQRRKAIDDINQLKIDGMKDGFEKDLDNLKETQRKERETILYNTDLTETERAEELKLLKEKNFQDELNLINKHQADILQIQKDGQKETLANTVEFYDNLIKEDQNNSTYKIALLEANEKTEELKLKEKLDNKLISQEEYNKQVIKLQSDLAQAKLDETLAEDAAEKTRLENKLNDISALPNSPEKDKAAQKVLEELDALEKKTNLDAINGSNEVTDKKLSNLKLISDAQKKIYEDELTQLSDFNKAVGKGLDDRNKAQLDALKTQSSQIDSELAVQTQLFKDGLDNTLAYEQKAKAENTRQQLAAERKAAKEKKGIELANTYISFLQSYLKDGTDAQGAATKALAQTLIAEGIADAIAGTALEGTEDTGNGNLNLDGKGGMLYMVHPNERILTKEQNAMIGNISNDDLAHTMANLYSPNMQMQIPSDNVGGRGSVDWGMLVELNGKMIRDGIEKGFEKIHVTNLSEDIKGNLVEKVSSNGLNKTIVHRKNIFR